jgi:exonuclease SbcC
VADYAEFKRRQQEYQNRLNAAANLKSQLDNLRKQARRGKELRRLIHAREKMLEHAFERVQASDYTAWMTGWETYHQNKRRQVELQQELQFHHEQLRSQEEKVQLSADQLREKLQNWGSSVSNVDEVLGIIMMVARRLRTKEEAEKEFNSLKLSYLTQLGQRNMDQLSKELEPIEDLESEEVLPDEKRKEGMQACQKELAAVESELKTAERSLQHTRLTTSITDLEIKLETARQKWQAHEDLRRALDDTENLLETSWQKWLTDYGNMLEAEARLINGRTFAAADSEDRNGRDDMKRQYFAYRMVLLLQALGDRPDAPIVFSVDVMKESQTFWKDILTYFLKLSRVRPVVFVTADSKLHKLASHLADQERIENESGEEKNGFTLKKADGFAPS